MRRIPTHKKWFAAALVCAVLLGAECIAAWAGGLLLLPGMHGFVTPGLGLLLTVLLGITLWKYCRAKQRISRPCIWLGGAGGVYRMRRDESLSGKAAGSGDPCRRYGKHLGHCLRLGDQ